MTKKGQKNIWHAKGQIKSKSRLASHRFSQKKTDEFDLFAVKSKQANKQIHFVVFWGKSAFKINWNFEEKRKIMQVNPNPINQILVNDICSVLEEKSLIDLQLPAEFKTADFSG